MKKYFKIILSGSFFFIAVIITVLLFPREGKFRYEFQKGMPWKHKNLIAKRNFPIYKSEEQVLYEKDSIFNNFSPYFVVDTNVASSVIKEFDSDFEMYRSKVFYDDSINFSGNKHKLKKTKDSLSRIKKYIHDNLVYLYNSYIYQKNNDIENIRQLTILKDNIGSQKNIDKIFSEKQAYEFLKKRVLNFNYSAKIKSVINFAKYIKVNIFYDEEKSKKALNQKFADVSTVSGMVQAGEAIIYKGELVDETKYRILSSLKIEYENSAGQLTDESLIFAGQIMLILAIFTMFFLYFFIFNPEILKNTKQILYIISLQVAFIIFAAILSKFSIFDIYILPIVILPILTTTFFNHKTALIQYIVTIIILGFLVPNGFEYIFIQFIVGLIAIVNLEKLNNRSQILKTSLIIFLAYSFIYTAIVITHEGDVSKIYLIKYLWFAGSSFLILMSYPLIYLFEKIFGFISDVTLIEISNTNRPLLRMLAEKAPGTFQHSVQVANLAEAAVNEINGNSLLVRAGALYHDIGKTANPAFFTENQHSGNNPHDNISPEKSAEIIISHITEGIKIAQKNNIPKEIIEFIKTHHGVSKIQWFVHKFKQENPDKEIDLSKFSYPFHKPQSVETSILMMADALEAAARSLKVINEESISNLVEKIIDYQISEKHFNNSDITFKQITIVKETFKQKLQIIYHSRIEYPE